ncbi:MAG: nitroreductase family protein [Acidimicrobiales bacterium]
MGQHHAADEVLDVIATTRAIRRYAPDPIPDDDLAAILFAASRAPSGSNRQSFRFLVLRDGPRAVEAKALLGAAFRAGWSAKRSDDGYETGSGVVDDSPKARTARAMQHFVDHFEQTPVVVLVCMVGRRGLLTDGGSVYPACQNLLLAARALGYGGVMTMWHHAVDGELRQLLGIPDDVPIAATIPLGRPLGGHGPVRRRPLDELVYDDQWESSASWAVEPEGTRHTAAGPRRGAG